MIYKKKKILDRKKKYYLNHKELDIKRVYFKLFYILGLKKLKKYFFLNLIKINKLYSEFYIFFLKKNKKYRKKKKNFFIILIRKFINIKTKIFFLFLMTEELEFYLV